MQRLSSLYTRSWYIYLVSCTSWQRYAIVGSFLAALSLGWFFAIYRPLINERYACEQKLEVLQKQCHACSCASGACKQLELSIKRLQNRLKSYQHIDRCPLIVCMDCAEKAGLLLHTCTMAQAMSGNQQEKELITVEVAGSINAYIKFLTLLAQLPYLVTYDTMHIECSPVEQVHATCTVGFVTIK